MWYQLMWFCYTVAFTNKINPSMSFFDLPVHLVSKVVTSSPKSKRSVRSSIDLSCVYTISLTYECTFLVQDVILVTQLWDSINRKIIDIHHFWEERRGRGKKPCQVLLAPHVPYIHKGFSQTWLEVWPRGNAITASIWVPRPSEFQDFSLFQGPELDII